ncbi:uncharacterized protein LOC117135027 [Drosophila busckii]|uniref:uncharacterized protein LOC117135027 n=1 Tax=Drosophila busckii TaxID=30019 RepID=UPI0014331999|nr:uncharacterized protein LOC117135027 [Drosophila busckii]
MQQVNNIDMDKEQLGLMQMLWHEYQPVVDKIFKKAECASEMQEHLPFELQALLRDFQQRLLTENIEERALQQLYCKVLLHLYRILQQQDSQSQLHLQRFLQFHKMLDAKPRIMSSRQALLSETSSLSH